MSKRNGTGSLSEEQRRKRIEAFEADDGSEPVWWWLSFVDETKPPGQRFQGVSIVRGQNMVQACRRAWELTCNPGGQVAGVEFPSKVVLEERFTNRLLTREEAEEADRWLKETYPEGPGALEEP